MNWEILFRDAVPKVAGVVVYDKGAKDAIGRFCVAKTIKLPNGQMRTTQSNRKQRPAALRLARNWLASRAKIMGVEYVPGAGAGTLLFKPIN